MIEVKATQNRLASADGHSCARIDCKGRERTLTSIVLRTRLTMTVSNSPISACMIFSLTASSTLATSIKQAHHTSAQLHQHRNLGFGKLQHLLVPAAGPLYEIQHLAQPLCGYRIKSLVALGRCDASAQ